MLQSSRASSYLGFFGTDKSSCPWGCRVLGTSETWNERTFHLYGSPGSATHFLPKKRFDKVLLLENGTLAVVSTGHAAANVRTLYSNPLTVKLAGQMFENDRDELGGDSYFQQIGFLIPLEEGSLAAGRHVLEMERQHGVEVSEFVLEDIEELAPRFNLQGVVSGIYEPRSDYADLVRTTHRLGRVDISSQPYESTNEMEEAEVPMCQLVESGEDVSVVFDLADEALHTMTLSV